MNILISDTSGEYGYLPLPKGLSLGYCYNNSYGVSIGGELRGGEAIAVFILTCPRGKDVSVTITGTEVEVQMFKNELRRQRRGPKQFTFNVTEKISSGK